MTGSSRLFRGLDIGRGFCLSVIKEKSHDVLLYAGPILLVSWRIKEEDGFFSFINDWQ